MRRAHEPGDPVPGTPSEEQESEFVFPNGCGNAPAGSGGTTGPAQPGRITTNAELELRIKIGRFSDPTLRGQMDATGRRVSGGAFGSGFNGQAFALNTQ